MAIGSYQVTISIVDQFTATLDKFNGQLKKVQMQSALAFSPFGNLQNSLKQSWNMISKGLGLDKVAAFMKNILDSALRIGKVFAGLVGIGGLFTLAGLMHGLRAFGEQGVELTNLQTRSGMDPGRTNTLDTANYLAGGRRGSLTEGMERSGDLAFASRWGMPEGMNSAWLRQLWGKSALDARGNAKTGDQLLRDDRDIVQKYKDPRTQALAAQMLGHSKDELPLLTATQPEFDRHMQQAKKSALSPQDIKSARELELQFRALQNSFTGVANVVMKALSPAITRLMTDFQKWLDSTGANGQKNIDLLTQKFDQIATSIERAGPWLVSFGQTLREWAPSLDTIKVSLEAIIGIMVGSRIAKAILFMFQITAALKGVKVASAAAAAANVTSFGLIGKSISNTAQVMVASSRSIITSIGAMIASAGIATTSFAGLLAAAGSYFAFKGGKAQANRLTDANKLGYEPAGIPGAMSENGEVVWYKGKDGTLKGAKEVDEEVAKSKKENPSLWQDKKDTPQLPSVPGSDDSMIQRLLKENDELQRKLDENMRALNRNTDETEKNTDAEKKTDAGQAPHQPFKLPSIGPGLHTLGRPVDPATIGQPDPLSGGLPAGTLPPFQPVRPGQDPRTYQQPVPYTRFRPPQSPDLIPPQAAPGQTGPAQTTTNTVNNQMAPEQKALLDTIGSGESGGRYDIRYGGNTFQVGEGIQHPNIPQMITRGKNAGKYSTAAGRYQFLKSTWDDEQRRLGLPDFSPANQDKAAWDLAQRTYRDKTGGDLATDVKDKGNYQKIQSALSGIWTSLHGSTTGEATQTPQTFEQRMQQSLTNETTTNNIQNNATGAIPAPPPLPPATVMDPANPTVMANPKGPEVNMNSYAKPSTDDGNDGSNNGQAPATQQDPVSGYISIDINHRNAAAGTTLTARSRGNALRGPVNVVSRNLPGFNSYYG